MMVTGTVSADFRDGLGGLYVQDGGDGDPATSDALFVQAADGFAFPAALETGTRCRFHGRVVELEDEHASFDELLSDLDRDSATLRADLERLFAELTVHIDKENLGIFPVAVVTLSAEGWDTVARAHGSALLAS